ncbi:MAG: GNAT family N-acetyltransferase [Hydrogenophaga sp.]|uniref:GNAT family N-acetyltransferase n=1 Tax=Hydrogenophaga sp. TaxID=1904254 RepID=UPI004035F99A
MRFLLDTNILIPLQDSLAILRPNLANFVRLAGLGHHQLLYHAASERDIERDRDEARRARTLQRLRQYTRLPEADPCPWNTAGTSVNDACDNEILYAIYRDAAHALITEDQKLLGKARLRGLSDRVYTIQTAEDLLARLHQTPAPKLLNIENVELHTFSNQLGGPFFNSLREAYDFDAWFRQKARDGRSAWIYRARDRSVAAMCIYAIQEDEHINDARERLGGRALKLCTFKVGELVRGRKIGELLLKAAFLYATGARCEHIFIHVNPARQQPLIDLLTDFGFKPRGSYGADTVFVKRHHARPPALLTPPVEYLRDYFPHYRSDIEIQKFIVPIQPKYHKVIFPDYPGNGGGPQADHQAHVGNAIKLAYLSHAPSNRVQAGDIVLFYRSQDMMSITSLGVVERVMASSDADEIVQAVRRRTVYSRGEIEQMARRLTKVMLFRHIEHFEMPRPYAWLRSERIVHGYIQSITRIPDESFSRILRGPER